MVDNNALNDIWKLLVSLYHPTNQSFPIGIVLGGQPGAGKSTLTKVIRSQKPDFIVINADEFRPWHPLYDKIQAQYEKESAKQTSVFAGEIAEKILEKAIEHSYNLIIEGTFRTVQTPLKTLKRLKDAGYHTEVHIKTAPAAISWERCLSRYEIGKLVGEGKERFTTKEHHDLVVSVLPANADTVLQSGLADRMIVMDDAGEIIFDSVIQSLNPSYFIETELRRGMCFQNKVGTMIYDRERLTQAYVEKVTQANMECWAETDDPDDVQAWDGAWGLYVETPQGILLRGPFSSENEALENLQLEFPDVKWPEEAFEIGENGVNLKAGAQALFECSQIQESGSSKVRVR